jgi:hypothetical protein
MPFAIKFRAMMDLPFAGDTVGDLTVEDVEVCHESVGPGQYAYAVRMVLCGPGGQRGVKQALKSLFSSHPMTFSGYGNPYQLWFGKPAIEPLGDQRYAVQIEGAGARVFLDDELYRFLGYLNEQGLSASRPEQVPEELLIEEYLEQYRAQIKRKVDRYRSKLRRTDVVSST